MSYRLIKQITFILIYCLIFFFLGWGVYKFIIYRPTCFDGKQNQGETAIDCGGPCPACEIVGVPEPQILEKIMLPATSNLSNLFIKLRNQSGKYGAESIEYRIKLRNFGGGVLKEFTRKDFLLPLQIKYLIIPNIEILAKDVVSIDFIIEKIKWKEIAVSPDILSIIGERAHFSGKTEPGYILIEGNVINRGGVVLDAVSISSVIFDKSQPVKSVAVGATNVYTLLPNESRYFRIIIPEPIPGIKKTDIDLTNIDVSADANLFLYY